MEAQLLRFNGFFPRAYLPHRYQGFSTSGPFSLIVQLRKKKYTFVRDSRQLEVDGIQTYAVLGKSHHFSSRKEVSGVVRVSDFTQSLVLQADEKGNTKGMKKS